MKINLDKVPSTVDEAIDEVIRGLTQEDVEEVKKVPPAAFHHSVGQFLRNNWSLWAEDTPLKRDFKDRFGLFGHADDISGIILEGVTQRVNGNDKDTMNTHLKLVALNYTRHWVHFRVDPATGQRKE